MTDMFLYKDKQSSSDSMAESRFCVHIKLSLIVCFSITAYLFSLQSQKGKTSITVSWSKHYRIHPYIYGTLGQTKLTTSRSSTIQDKS